MADVITRFKLETSQYDSKLRDSAKSLATYSKQAELAGKDFDKFTKGGVEAARALGNIATSANNTKDKVKELVSAYNDVARAYNKLTQEQQQSDFAKAMANSLRELQDRIKETKQELYGIGDAAKGVGGGGSFGDMTKGILQVFGGNMMTMAAGKMAELGSEIGNVINQSMELAKESEGVRIAFERLNHPDLLDQLNEATHGTVSNFELMKAAVKFQDFKLPLDQLGTMLAFAQQKAKDTGQSVDYMVDSIVTGLGRKSLMILDNLGLSANEIKEKMKETGDMTKAVGAIIREQMSKSGEYVETAAERAAQATKEANDKMEELGRSMKEVLGFSGWSEISTAIRSELIDTLQFTIDTIGRAKQAWKDFKEFVGGVTGGTAAGALQDAINKAGGGKGRSKGGGGAKPVDVRKSGGYEVVTDENGNVISATSYAGGGAAGRDMTAFERKRTGQGGGGKPGKGGGKGTRTLSEAEKAAEDIAKAEKDYATALKNAGIKKSESLITGDEYDKQMLSAQQRLAEAYLKVYDVTGNEEYLKTFKDHAQSIRTQKETIDANIAAQKADEQVIRQHEAAVKKLYEEEKKQAELSRTWQTSNSQGIGNYIGKQQSALSTATYGSSEYAAIAGNLADATAYKELMQKAIQTGMNDIVVDSAPLWSRIINNEDIDDNDWQALVDKINEKLAEMELNPIEIDFSTGKVKEQSKEMTKDWNAAASAIQAVGSAMMQIEDPMTKVMGTIAQAVATIALGYAEATKKAAETHGPWGWIAFAATGLATTLSTIAAIKSATAGSYATGGIVPGNNHNDGLIAHVSSGELILNAAQQGNIASLLSDRGSQVGSSLSYVSGENIILGVNNTLMRKGKGEIVTTSMLRSKGIL